MADKSRCGWCGDDPLYVAYHDDQWGRPVWNDNLLFEMLILEGAQAGLSWITILRRREGYRAAFDGFDPHKIVAYDAAKIASLMTDTRIIRNRLKIQSAVTNAEAFLRVQAEFGQFATYLWGFVGGRPKHNCWPSLVDVPANTTESDAMSKDMKKRGFKFVGTTICYAYMQACGLVNDHVDTCWLSPC